MTIKAHDVVKVMSPINSTEPYRLGTVVYIWSDGAYEVEFITPDGPQVVTVPANQVLND